MPPGLSGGADATHSSAAAAAKKGRAGAVQTTRTTRPPATSTRDEIYRGPTVDFGKDADGRDLINIDWGTSRTYE
jgi:hypothetical protein